MSEYSSMSHQQLYDYVFSGSPSNVESEATLNKKHATSVSDATTELKKTLTSIQASWSGSAADEFSQQANSIVQQMEQHAQNADTTSTWMSHASQALSTAQKTMPSPPSSAEQGLADINTNSVSEWGVGILTGGTSYLASKAAAEDISKKKAAAVSAMTKLASAYNVSNDNLTGVGEQMNDSGTDVDAPVSSGTNNSQNDKDGSTSGSNGNGSNSGSTFVPIAMLMPSSGDAGGDSEITPRVSTGARSVQRSTGSSSGTPGLGVTDPKQPTTVTSGLGDLPTSGSTTGIPSSFSGTTTGSGYSGGGTGGIGGLGAGGLADFGGSGAAGLSDGGGESSLGSSGSGARSVPSGETGTGEIGEEAGGTGYGTPAGSDSSLGGAGSAAGSPEGAGASNQDSMMGGGMGGMGHGAGGGQDERGDRAGWLKEDPDFWYSDKMKNAAPPGGVIG